MDGVNVEQAIGRDRIRSALKRYENKPVDEHRYGLVRSVNADGSYEVLLDGDVQTSRCAQFDTALVGDRVLAVTKKDGTNDLLGRLGGPIGGGGTIVTQYDDVSNYIAGRVFAYAGTDEPIGALLCDGRAVSRTTYWELFAAIGTTYGSGDGSSTFNLPNIESRTIIGESDSYTLGSTGGEESVSLTAEQNGSHTHAQLGVNAHEPNSTTLNLTLQGDGNMVLYQYGGVLWNTGTSSAAEKTNRTVDIGQDGTTGSSGSGVPHNNMQPYIVMRYFITTGKGDPVSGINPADYVVEWKNDDDGWYWEKWASGKAYCRKRTLVSWVTGVAAWGGTYESTVLYDSGAYPFEFAEVPDANVYIEGSGQGNYMNGTRTTGAVFGSTTYPPRVYLQNDNGSEAYDKGGYLVTEASGFWKTPSASGGTESIAPTIAERFEKLEPVVLYDNASGTTGTVALSETAANFTMLEIYFTDNVNRGNSSNKVYSPNGKQVHHVQVQEVDSSNYLYFRFSNYTISGTTITPIYNDGDKPGYLRRSFEDGSMVGNFGQYLKITQVVGYK